MKKVVFFVDKLTSSGASKIISWIVNNANLEDAQISLVTYMPIADQREVGKSVNRINFSIKENNRVKRSLLVIKQLRSLFRKENTDLCIAFLPMECMYALTAAVGTKTKIIVCERSDPYLEKSPIVDFARVTFRFADGAVFQTQEAMDYFPEVLQRKSVVIANPAFKRETALYVPYKERPNEVSFSGRLFIRQKRQDVLFKAIRKVIDDGYDIILNIYGDGPDRERLESLAKEMGLSEQIYFAGNVENVEERISNSKMLVLSSDYEGIPNVVIEALQCGVPVVSTDCSPGGARLLIENGKNGYVVPREDYKSLAERIEELLQDDTKAELMSKNALEIIHQFDETSILLQWETYFKTLLEG